MMVFFFKMKECWTEFFPDEREGIHSEFMREDRVFPSFIMPSGNFIIDFE